MIDGVTILASEVIMMSSTLGNALFCLFLFIAIIGVICLLFGAILDTPSLSLGGVVTVGASIIFCLLIALPIDAATQIPDYIKYEVILDDSVSMNEFINTYEVLEQRGQIYVVKEIEE